MSVPRERQRALLLRVARQSMVEHGLDPDFPAAALAEAKGLEGPAGLGAADLRDLRERLWCSIDNDDSRDLDQLTVAESLDGGGTRIFVAVALKVYSPALMSIVVKAYNAALIWLAIKRFHIS